ncbi:MAG TPA: chemotaxis protein CheW [Xanthobacteraceae bacterium]|jgi:purine-binding chemotaxis protein CheW|nr:chemotaxis protein CheW [Xanthobacteraceae bacterium]
MSVSVAGHNGKAAALRLAFDRAFAEPAQMEDRSSRIGFLAIHVGQEPFAIRLAEISGLHADKRITPVPGGSSALLGIAGFRGSILPVYSLRVLLGITEQSANEPTPRWLVIAAAAPVAFAFNGFDGQRRVHRDTIAPQAVEGHAQAHTQGFVRSRKMAGPILHLPSLLATINAAKIEAGPR